MTTLALWLLPIAAVACWRWSRLVASALAAALGAWLLYRYAWQWEKLRWVSAATGLFGTWELGRRRGLAERMRRGDLSAKIAYYPGATFYEIAPQGYREGPRYVARMAPHRPDILAILLIWSSLADGLSLLLWRKTGLWGVLPALQAITLAVMIAVAVWPRRKHA